jgi:ribonuclease E
VLRGIEEEGAKRRAAEIVVYAAPQVALYILNHKRERLGDIETRYGMRVLCLGDDGQMSSQFRIDRVRAQVAPEAPAAVTQEVTMPPPEIEPEEDVAVIEEETEANADDLAPAASGEAQEESEHHRRRRRRRGGRREDSVAAEEAPPAAGDNAGQAEIHVEGVPEHAEGPAEEEGRGRRRGRRGGRRRRHDGKGDIPAHAEPGAEQPDLPPVYAGPTPANPFGGNTFDIFDILEQAEAAPPPKRAERPAPEPIAPVIIDAPEPAAAETRRNDAAGELEAAESPAMAEPALVEATAVEPSAAVAETMPDREPRPEPLPEPSVAMAEAEAAHAAAVPAILAAEPVPEPMVAANDAAPAPAIQPIIIGGEQDVAVQKKRGWWRR